MIGFSFEKLNRLGWEYLPGAIDCQNVTSIRQIKQNFLELVSHIGNVSEREGLTRIVKANQSGDTYSTSLGLAPLHTDSSYYPDPERWICILCIVPAKRGGALRLLRVSDAISHLRTFEPKFVDLLREAVWYFSSPLSQGNFQFGPVPALTSESFRWRPDQMWSESKPKTFAFSISKYFEINPKLKSIKLKSGDVIIINNCKTLHGRSQFNDINRFHMRIRVQ